MGYRFDMHGRDPQVQAIVRNRDAEEKRREEEFRKRQERIECSKAPKNGDYESVYFTKGKKQLLELRVSGTAIQNGPCGLIEEDITNWLCKTGNSFISDVKEFEILMITSKDVIDKELKTKWENLRREEVKASE